MIINFILKLSL